MLNKRRAVLVGGVFLVAVATGHLMQNGDALARMVYGAPDVPLDAVAKSDQSSIQGSLPGLRESSVVALSAGSDPESAGLVPAVEAEESIGLACAPFAMTITSEAPALLRVSLDAPCRPSDTVVLAHAGLEFGITTDAMGLASVVLPAFAPDGRVTARFAMGGEVTGAAPVEGLETLERVAVIWNGPAGVSLNAFEKGAAWGKPGHVSRERPNDPAKGGGFLTVVAHDGAASVSSAEIYTRRQEDPAATYEVDVAVSEATCGKTLAGRIIRLQGGKMAEEPISLTMPTCGQSGGFVALGLKLDPSVTVATN
jgi:hypothetical protein